MISTVSSEPLLKVENLKLHVELQHYHTKDVRDVFVSAFSNPVDFFFKQKELFYVLDGVSITIERGMRVGILGVNGTGKTTLCRCIAGMMRAQSGKIETNGKIRAIFDTGSGVMPELTGRENAFLLGRLFFPEVKDLKTIVNESIEFSELGHFIDIPFKQYSKGMQARLLLSLVSSRTTDLLILDEVFDGADIFFQRKLAERMRAFIENAGATIFVSHSIDQIRQVCNQVLILDHGKVKYFGDLEAGITMYQNLRTPPKLSSVEQTESTMPVRLAK